MARRDWGTYPTALWNRGATKPDGLFRVNPSGGGSFARGRRWLGHHSPPRALRAAKAALAAAKISRRRTPRSFQTGSDYLGCNRLRKCLTFPMRLWEAARCNAGIVVTDRRRQREECGMERRSASKSFGGRSTRYGAGGDIAAQCPYLNPAGEMFAYVRLCSPMFA